MVWIGTVRSGPVRQGQVGHGLLGQGPVGFGLAWQGFVGHGSAKAADWAACRPFQCSCGVWRDRVLRGMAWHGQVWVCEGSGLNCEQFFPVQLHHRVGSGRARQGLLGQGLARYGVAKAAGRAVSAPPSAFGGVGRGALGLGMARYGMVGCGGAW